MTRIDAGRVTVIGLDGGRLPAGAEHRLRAATLVVGAARHLAAAGALPPVPTRELTGDIGTVLDEIAAADGQVVVLASGDPGFFGVLRLLVERLGRARVEVLPAVSSVALAFARVALPWDDALVVSAHGRALGPAVAAALAHPKVAVLTAPGSGPAELGAALRGSGRDLVVAEHLGTPDERVVSCSPEEAADLPWAEPNVVLVLDEVRAVASGKGWRWPAPAGGGRPGGGAAPGGAAGWALPENAFAHRDGMVTKAEVRALALARLGPGVGDLVWDVGAGSGSVGVECARLGAAVVAVERDAEAAERVASNAVAHGVEVRVVLGAAPGALVGLPEPDAVFVGGTGGALGAVLDACAVRAGRAVVVTLAAVDRVVMAQERLAAHGLVVDTVLLQASRLRGVGGVHRLAAQNPVFVLSGLRP